MARTKRRRFAALGTMPNVVGRQSAPGWFDRAFGPGQTVFLELGCGRGEYTLALARGRPGAGVVGVDRHGARLWIGARRALDDGLTNARFLQSSIEDIEAHIPPGRVQTIWLPFPDPLRKNRQARHRLPSRLFLERYRRLLRPGGVVYLKTDDAALVTFAERSVRAAGGRIVTGRDRLAGDPDPVAAVETAYEARYRREGRPIYERTFRLD